MLNAFHLIWIFLNDRLKRVFFEHHYQDTMFSGLFHVSEHMDHFKIIKIVVQLNYKKEE